MAPGTSAVRRKAVTLPPRCRRDANPDGEHCSRQGQAANATSVRAVPKGKRQAVPTGKLVRRQARALSLLAKCASLRYGASGHVISRSSTVTFGSDAISGLGPSRLPQSSSVPSRSIGSGAQKATAFAGGGDN